MSNTDIETALLTILARQEGWGKTTPQTSPTEVCGELAKMGFHAGSWCRGMLRPDRDLMERVMDVASDSGLTVTLHGNRHSIAF